MLSAELKANGQLVLSGQLSLYSLAQAARDLDAQLARFAAPVLTVDLAQMEVSGSAILALLLHLRRAAAAKGARLALKNPPPQLARIAAPAGVQSALPL